MAGHGRAGPNHMSDAGEFARSCDAAIAECHHLGYVPKAWMAMVERQGAVKGLIREEPG